MGKNGNERTDLAVKQATGDINIEIINIFSKKDTKNDINKIISHIGITKTFH